MSAVTINLLPVPGESNLLVLLLSVVMVSKIAVAGPLVNEYTQDTAPSGRPKAVSVPAEAESVTENDMVHIVFVSNRSFPKVNPKDGVFFPESGGSVLVRRLKFDPDILLAGLPARGFNEFAPQQAIYRSYMYQSLRVEDFELTLRQGVLSASGELVEPILLTFEDQLAQPRILLWPDGCMALFTADHDLQGHLHVNGDESLREAFGNATDSASNNVVKLWLSLDSDTCTTNLPAGTRDITFDCLAESFAQARQQQAEVQRQIDTVAAFEKLFRSVASQSANLPFWKELDQKCQLITQGRLGILEYGFEDDLASRLTACQAVSGDLAGAPGLTPATKHLVEVTVMQTNVAVIEEITDNVGGEKTLAQISTQLKGLQQKLSVARMPAVSAEFRYVDPGTKASVILGWLDFGTATPSVQNGAF